jgi:hypothetical protein
MGQMIDWAEPAGREAVEVLADALERLGARIHRDLNAETREAAPLDDPEWDATLAQFTAFAEDCLQVLEDARVLAALGLPPADVSGDA